MSAMHNNVSAAIDCYISMSIVYCVSYGLGYWVSLAYQSNLAFLPHGGFLSPPLLFFCSFFSLYPLPANGMYLIALGAETRTTVTLFAGLYSLLAFGSQ